MGLEWIDINLILQPCGHYGRNVGYTVIENVGGGACLIGGGGGGENACGYAPEWMQDECRTKLYAGMFYMQES